MNDVTHRFQFGTPHRGGTISLFNDATVQVRLSPILRDEITSAMQDISESSLFWGASLTIGLGAVGAILHYNRHEKAAWPVFAMAGLSGLTAAGVRSGVWSGQSTLEARLPLSQVQMFRNTVTGEMILSLQNTISAAPALRLKPDEFDEAAARAFLSALESVRTR